MVTVSGLNVSYENNDVLHDINAVFPDGKITVIIGPNGCGKSTFLKALMRLVPSLSGTVTLEGRSLYDYSQKELARHMTYLPQSRNIPDIVVSRLVMHGRFPYLGYPRNYKKEDHELVRWALKELEIEHLAKRKMETLSGGQRQKVYLAMAMVQQTAVILMDEPTTYLDIRNQFEILDEARILADQGKTVIMILHDFDESLQYADQVILMENGCIRQTGTAKEVLGSPLIEEIFGVTPRIYETDDGWHCTVRPKRTGGAKDRGKDQI